MNEPEPTRNQEILRLISAGAADLSIVLLDAEGVITHWAGGTPELEGYAPEEVVGRHFSIFMTADDRAAGEPERVLRSAIERGLIESEGWRVRRDGTRYWANVLTSVVRDGNGQLIGFVRINRDLSKRQRALDMLLESELRYRHLVEVATDIIYAHDLQGRILSLNAAGEKLFGSPRESLIGRSIFDVVAPEFHENVKAMVAQKLEHGGSTTHALDVVAQDGRRISLEVSTQLIYEEGQPIAVQGIARDITERQRAAETLERSERYFRTLIESAADAITIVNADGTVRYSSPAVERLIGYPPAERRGRAILDLVHPDDLAPAREVLGRLRTAPSTPLHAVLRVRHRDGSWRHIDLNARNLLADPNVGGIILNWRDITPEVVAEEKLREREHFFRSIIERSSDILIVLGSDRSVRYISPSSTAILGIDPAQLVGTSGFELIHPDDAPAVASMLEALFEGGTAAARNVTRVRTARGDYRTFDVRGRNLMSDPVFEGIVLNARDITESTRVEEALRESEQRFRGIIETSSEGICICDADGVITFVNERYAEMFGYTEAELLGVAYIDMVAPEDRQLVIQNDTRRRETGKPEQFDVAAVRKDGSRISVITSTSSLFDHHGNYIGALALLTDITERKQLEAQLRQAQKIEAVGQLAGGIAHDFNNLLTAIRGHVDLLLAEVPADSPYRSDIDEIRSGADRAATLTQQLLAFSRRQILQPRVLEFDRVIGDVQTLVSRLIGEDIELITDLDAATACVRADRGRLEQVLVNLAVNARDAMPAGGTLKIGTRLVDIDDDFVRANPGSRAGTFVQLTVEDTGHGMNANTLSHVFEPFFTTKPPGQGTGLGLATVYGIVKQSDGYIRVHSEYGVGTRFEILLPLVKAPAEPVSEERVARPATAAHATVLVAEDEDSVRTLTSRILRKQGYHVLEAKHGMDALDLARIYEGPIDLLLTDIVMPVMGGRELREQLFALRPDMKVLYMSGYTDDVLLQRGVSEAQGGFLEKPFTPDALVAKVREVLAAG